MLKESSPANSAAAETASAAAGKVPAEHSLASATGVEAEKDRSQYDLLDDCRMMLRFAVKEGVEPDESLRKDIAALDGVLLAAGEVTISELPAKLVAARPLEKGKVVIDETGAHSAASSASHQRHEHGGSAHG
jgi:hypothetical protein